MSNGWEASAGAWVASLGDDGDFTRRHVLDPAMLARISAKTYASALDVGCGEGRFCRILRRLGIRTVGIDPTRALIARARALDPEGAYRIEAAERMAFPDGAFDLVVSYLSLIDIADLRAAIGEMTRVLRPGGTLLIANLTSFSTAAVGRGWSETDGAPRFGIDHYLAERSQRAVWEGIDVENWHRPLGVYLSLLIAHGLTLRHFDEPAPTGGDPREIERYRRVPWALVMEWEKT